MVSSPFSKSEVVVVTGGNGLVAQHTIDQMLGLDGGPKVITTVRSQSSSDTIKKHYAKHVTADRLRVAIVGDITEESAFYDAIKGEIRFARRIHLAEQVVRHLGVTHIAHVASPLIMNPQSVEDDLLKPAIAGTLSILRAAAREPSVKKVVITSTFAASVEMAKGWRPDYDYDESGWNPITYEEASAPGATFPEVPPYWRIYVTYCASKALAERAAWDFVAKHKPSFAVSTILPTYIFGPSILPLPRGHDSFNFSNQLIWRIATKDELPPMDWPQFIDVRDVARLHVAALQTEEANGERFFASTADFSFKDVC